MNQSSCTLEMKNISIEFPGVKALSGVDFSMRSGEIRAIVGANGAGKSTLMKILAGANGTYTGDILIDSQGYQIRSPRVAKDLGIEIVYQEVDSALFPYLSVAENIMFNTLVTKMKGRCLINWNKIQDSAKEILERLHVDLDVRRLVSTLTLAQKQMVLIARAVREKCRFLILDEPTAPLSLGEVGELFRIIKDLAKDENVGVIFISHRLPELFQVCQELTILKDGKVVADRSIDDTLTTRDIVNLMLGKSFDEAFAKTGSTIGETILRVQHLRDAKGKVRDVSFELRRGEIVGVAGLVGAGKSELCKLLFGANKAKSGDIVYKGRRLNLKTPTKAVRQKIGLVPEERRKEGVLVGEPVYFNLSAACLGKFSNAFSFIRKGLELANARKYIEELNIKTPSEFQKVKLLSGGNQQKVAVGKWLASDSDVYLLDEPTKGVDVGAKMEIFQIIQGLARAGKAVLYVSSEISEILAITDRAYVMYNGEFVAELNAAKATENEILYFATGGK